MAKQAKKVAKKETPKPVKKSVPSLDAKLLDRYGTTEVDEAIRKRYQAKGFGN